MSIPKINKNLFYIRSLYYRTIVPFESKSGRFHLLLCEMTWLLNSFLPKKIIIPDFLKRDYFETKFGNFYTDRDLINNIIISPAFERQDKDILLKLINDSVNQKEKILFIDVGAHVGTYSIAVGNEFKRYKNIEILAYEPGSSMFSIDSFKLLKKNLKLNKIKNVKAFGFGLGIRSEVNKIGIKTKKLDDLLSDRFVKKFDTVFIKIDIEGFEIEALMGANKFIKKPKKLIIMVEDCVDTKVQKFLKKEFKFMFRKTPYNSFWVKNNFYE